MQSDIAAVMRIGANVPLSFSNPVTLTVPVDLPDGSIVQIYTSRDGDTWETVTTA